MVVLILKSTQFEFGHTKTSYLLQMKLAQCQNDSELARLLSESRLNIMSGINVWQSREIVFAASDELKLNYLLSLLCNEACYSSIKYNTSGLTFNTENNICILGKSCIMIDNLTYWKTQHSPFNATHLLFTLYP